MASFVWHRDPDEAYHNPYEHEAQRQFLREARAVLNAMRRLLCEYDMRFHLNDRTPQKAIWLLQSDALASLVDACAALEATRHRAAARVFREVIETLDLARYFATNTEKSNRALAKWYGDEIIPHSECRTHMEAVQGAEYAAHQRARYRYLSKFTHRSHSAIIACCGLGHDDMMWHENHSETELSMLPQPQAAYCAVLASYILGFCDDLSACGLLQERAVQLALNGCMEKVPVPRRFAINGPWGIG